MYILHAYGTYVYGCGYACAITYVWSTENNCLESVVSFHHVDIGVELGLFGLVAGPLLSYLANPWLILRIICK